MRILPITSYNLKLKTITIYFKNLQCTFSRGPKKSKRVSSVKIKVKIFFKSATANKYVVIIDDASFVLNFLILFFQILFYKESCRVVLIHFLGVCNLPNLRGTKILLIPLVRDTRDSEFKGSVREK